MVKANIKRKKSSYVKKGGSDVTINLDIDNFPLEIKKTNDLYEFSYKGKNIKSNNKNEVMGIVLYLFVYENNQRKQNALITIKKILQSLKNNDNFKDLSNWLEELLKNNLNLISVDFQSAYINLKSTRNQIDNKFNVSINSNSIKIMEIKKNLPIEQINKVINELGVTSILFTGSFDQSIDGLSDKIKYITIISKIFNKVLSNFPNNLLLLQIEDDNFNSQISGLPNSLETLVISSTSFDQELVFPEGLQMLGLKVPKFSRLLNKLPNSLLELYISRDYKGKIKFPNKLESFKNINSQSNLNKNKFKNNP